MKVVGFLCEIQAQLCTIVLQIWRFIFIMCMNTCAAVIGDANIFVNYRVVVRS